MARAGSAREDPRFMPPSADPLLAEAHSLLTELRARCEAPSLGERPEELLIDGYATALRLEGARRRVRARALELSQWELDLAAQEQALRALLGMLRERLAREGRADGGASGGGVPDVGSARAAQTTSPRRSA
jgi:hypothetical protein